MPKHTPKEKAKNRRQSFKENRAQPFGKTATKTKAGARAKRRQKKRSR